MPDMERVLRSLELHVADTTEKRAFVLGTHAGIDKARKQIAWIVVGVAVATLIASAIAYR